MTVEVDSFQLMSFRHKISLSYGNCAVISRVKVLTISNEHIQVKSWSQNYALDGLLRKLHWSLLNAVSSLNDDVSWNSASYLSSVASSGAFSLIHQGCNYCNTTVHVLVTPLTSWATSRHYRNSCPRSHAKIALEM